MKNLFRALAGIGLALVMVGAASADDYVAKDGNGRLITFGARLKNGILYPYHFGPPQPPSATLSVAESCHLAAVGPATLLAFTINTLPSAGSTDWIMVLDAAVVPTNSTLPSGVIKDWGRIGSSSSFGWELSSAPISMVNGIVICISTTGPFQFTSDPNAVFSIKASTQ